MISVAFWLAIYIWECARGDYAGWEAPLYFVGAALLAFLCGCVLQVVGWFLFDVILDLIFDFQRIRKRKAAAEKAVDEKYEMEMRLYEEACAIQDKAAKEMDKAIDEANKKCEELKFQRRQLYAMNVLHPNSQNMLAVNQIRDYLEMGICDRLEGTNGAYAQYMQDVRANRICASIDELRETVKRGIAQINGKMSALLFEMRSTNDSINAMNASIGSGLSFMRQAIINGQTNQRAALNEANGHLRNISDTLRDVGHNEYIALKESNVSAYLRRIG